MKKLYTSLAALLLSVSMAFAQTPANRTSNTIIADVLAQMPAGNGQNFNSLMSDLASTGADGVRSLVSMLKAQGQGDNANVQYAISGLSSSQVRTQASAAVWQRLTSSRSAPLPTTTARLSSSASCRPSVAMRASMPLPHC